MNAGTPHGAVRCAAIVGPQGAGKTTLVKLLLGELAPDSGEVKRGTKLEVAYSDQLRDTLDPELNLADSVIEVNGDPRLGRNLTELRGSNVGMKPERSMLGIYAPQHDAARCRRPAAGGGGYNHANIANAWTAVVDSMVKPL